MDLRRPLAMLWYPGAILIVGAALPVELLLRVLTAPFDRDRRVPGRFLRAVGSTLVRIFPPWRVEVEGELPDGAFVLVANHRSWLDIFVLSRLPREMKWLAKAELFRAPYIGVMFKLSGDIPVRRGDAESGGAALARAADYLSRGVPVVFFPEGTRSRDGALGRFKLGAFQTAVDAGVPVVPVALTGTAEGMAADSLRLSPSRIVARILAPVRSSDGDPARLRDEVRARIAAALDEVAYDPAAAARPAPSLRVAR